LSGDQKGNRAPSVPVAGQLHRHAFGDAGSYKIPNGGTAEVVWNATRRSGFFACVPPRLREASDSLTFDLLAGTVENPAAENFLGFQSVVLGLLSLQELL
jgi:hypothetical protein